MSIYRHIHYFSLVLFLQLSALSPEYTTGTPVEASRLKKMSMTWPAWAAPEVCPLKCCGFVSDATDSPPRASPNTTTCAVWEPIHSSYVQV